MRKTQETTVFSLDDTIDNDNVIKIRQTSYFDVKGQKIGGGLKPFTQKEETIRQRSKKAIIVDMGIWSGKTMEPLIDELIREGSTIHIIAGFIKEKAKKRFENKGVVVETILPFSDYNDWAEMRDLLVLFIKSGFFIGKRSYVNPQNILPYGVFLENKFTYYTQPSTNLGAYYELLSDIDCLALSKFLLDTSRKLWVEIEKLNPNLTLGSLRNLFPARFSLPLLSEKQLGNLKFVDEKPSDAILKLYDII